MTKTCEYCLHTINIEKGVFCEITGQKVEYGWMGCKYYREETGEEKQIKDLLLRTFGNEDQRIALEEIIFILLDLIKGR